jgi:hypothetical protein
MYLNIIGCICFDSDHNDIDRSMKKLEWNISKFCFYNSIFPKCESCNDIYPINLIKKGDMFSLAIQHIVHRAWSPINLAPIGSRKIKEMLIFHALASSIQFGSFYSAAACPAA